MKKNIKKNVEWKTGDTRWSYDKEEVFDLITNHRAKEKHMNNNQEKSILQEIDESDIITKRTNEDIDGHG